MIQNYLNPKGHQNRIGGSKVTAILLKGWILPIGGVALGFGKSLSLQTAQPLNFPGSGKKLPRKHELKVIIIVFWSLTSKLLLSSLFLLMQGTESQVISDLNYSLLVI